LKKNPKARGLSLGGPALLGFKKPRPVCIIAQARVPGLTNCFSFKRCKTIFLTKK